MLSFAAACRFKILAGAGAPERREPVVPGLPPVTYQGFSAPNLSHSPATPAPAICQGRIGYGVVNMVHDIWVATHYGQSPGYCLWKTAGVQTGGAPHMDTRVV